MSRSITSTIDHALLHPTLTDDEFRAGCELADQLGVASACVKPYHVAAAAQLLANSKVTVSTVIGFPHGGHVTAAKVLESEIACREGAVELDMVVNVGKVFSGDWSYVADDIRAVVDAGHAAGATVKVIFETGYYADDAPKIKLGEICTEVGADYVKTSTGFGFIKQADGGYVTTGATEHDVALMRKYAGANVGVKASGGVRTYADAVRMVELGATRLGTSSSAAIAAEEKAAASPA